MGKYSKFKAKKNGNISLLHLYEAKKHFQNLKHIYWFTFSPSYSPKPCLETSKALVKHEPIPAAYRS